MGWPVGTGLHRPVLRINGSGFRANDELDGIHAICEGSEAAGRTMAEWRATARTKLIWGLARSIQATCNECPDAFC